MSKTIKDIANLANVSVSTVSRVLNNKFDVSSKTREKILKLMDEHGYKPNSIARGLVSHKTFTVGLIIPDISNPFFAELACSIENRAKNFGYSVIFYNTDNENQREKDAVKLMQSKMVDGVIVSFSRDGKEDLEELNTILPTVQIDRKIHGIECSGVFIDNKISAYNATKYLIKLGHQKIVHFTGNLKTLTGIDRLEGFKNAVNDAGISDKNILIIDGRYSVDSGKETMKKLLESHFKPTAVFAASDLQAAGALYIAGHSGIKVPGELSIIGHDDIDLSYLVNPNLTTMAQPKRQLGELAMDLLINKIENKASKIISDDNKDIVLNTKLVIRESTGRV
ncbi:MAG TPA: LacI family DNA-binding transcriptional regulator [Victivallales bacterium]|nr:LacI family DNA-binding transcriptional regulator [Victivallales bacterium]